MVRMKDIAKAAEVSNAAVSRALRNSGYVSAQTKEKILKVAEELDYVVDKQAQSLRSKSSKTIGVIASDIGNPFYSLVLMEMIVELKKQGYSLVLGYSNENPDDELEYLKLMMASRVAGIIITPVDNSNKKSIKKLINYKIPVLQLYRQYYYTINSLIVDDEMGAYLATCHLIENGHTDILILSADAGPSPGRVTGYLAAMTENNLPIQEDLAIYSAPNSDIKLQFSECLEKLNFTGVIAGTNTFGLDVYAVCNERGISVPDDLSLIVFDDVPWVTSLNITAISQPIASIASTSVGILLHWINGDVTNGDVTNIKIEPKLITRRSVKKLN